MDMSKKSSRYILIGVIVVFAIVLLIDRYDWAQISQWREDQATNVWLGYTATIGNMPVGLISSTDIPNPNGMVLLGFLLSALPNLLSISFFLGLVQMILLTMLGWKSFKGNWHYFLLTVIPPLTSVILRSTSVEYWNQYMITLINISFIFLAFKYLEKPSLWYLPPITALILLAPALYLAGLVNAIVIALLTIGIIFYRRPKMDGLGVVLLIIVSLGLLSLFLTWLPYFQKINLKQITAYNKAVLGPVTLFQTAWQALFGLPIYATFQWADKSTFGLAFYHADSRILSPITQTLLRLAVRAYLIQAVFAFTTFIYLGIVALLKATSAKSFEGGLNSPIVRIVILSGLFISFSYTVSTWLGGPAWIKGERPDQTVQFLPMFLFFIFFLPLMITIHTRGGRIITAISYASLAFFGIVNLLCGFMILRDYLHYSGNVLTKADVPLTNKMQVINFIANDWRKHSNSNIIPVDYDLGGGIWDWIPEFGLKLSPWYPAPMTEGRSFDYELLREYGLTNYQEGVQLRTFGGGRYLITYAFEKPPQIEGVYMTNYVFGRLRVSITER